MVIYLMIAAQFSPCKQLHITFLQSMGDLQDPKLEVR